MTLAGLSKCAYLSTPFSAHLEGNKSKHPTKTTVTAEVNGGGAAWRLSGFCG